MRWPLLALTLLFLTGCASSHWPAEGTLTSSFGSRNLSGESRMHQGLDIAMASGTPVRAIAVGRVRFAGTMGGYGKTVVLEHDDKMRSLYAHLSEIRVREGQLVLRGSRIGLSGATGIVTGPHLHLEIQRDGKPVDPRRYLPRR